MIALLTSAALQAQVIVNVQLPAAGIHLKSQLWAVSLINTLSEEPSVTIEVLVTDVQTNQPVLSGVSAILRLKKGVTQITAATASPIVYNVLNAGYNIDANPMGFLPIGMFSICYRVNRVDGDRNERLAEECETIEIEPIGPPMLVLPFDEDEIETTRPLFSWIAASPHALFQNALYDLTLVEVLPAQLGSDAIQQNMPLLIQRNISMTSQPYPAGFPGLDSSKTYAWQVTAKNNTSSIVKSEVWVFRIKRPIRDSTTLVNHRFFAKVRRQDDAAYAIFKGTARYEYNNELNDSVIQVKLFDISRSKKEIPLDSFSYSVRVGQNLMSLDLQDLSGIIHNHFYLLEITNSRLERWYLKFEYRKPD